MSCGYIPSCAPSCMPSCAVPSCLPSCGSPCGYPVGGLSSLGSCGGVYGGAAPASSLGIVPGANIGCINQLPPSEVVIQPAPSVITVPGPILSASCDPLRVGGYSACGGSPQGYSRLSGRVCGYPC
uniref:feather keratin B-4-like n=1 Tax=Euleptes europaea TaxID=460621 RepID=UPI0025408A1C|nr:feather keratin B-4-like [Euleptes europaea]